MAGPRARRRSNRAKLALVVLAGLLGLLAVEGATRLLGLAPPPAPEKRGRLLKSVNDPVLQFVNRPGGVLRITYRDAPDAPPRRVVMRINDQGLRGPAVLVPKPEGTLRVACIGDSHTFGHGVPGDATWPAHLARLVRALPGGDAVEIVNFGVNNYNTVQEVAGLENEVLGYEPDIVLLQYYVNDASRRGLEIGEPREGDAIMRWTRPEQGGVLGWLRTRSRFVDYVCEGVYRRRGLRYYAAKRMNDYAEFGPGWVRAMEAIRRAQALLAEREIPFGVVLYPFLVREGGHFGSYEAFEIVKEFCADEGVPCLDTEPAFLASGERDLRISIQDYHGNSAANRIFAREVLRWLEERELLKR